MSYCVNCGVKLDPSQGKCPLCGTMVVNPAQAYDPGAERPFPGRTPSQSLELNKRYFVQLISAVLAVPVVVCLLIDLLMDGITWCPYPIGALCLVWLCLVTPVLITRYQVYLCVAIDGCGLLLYLMMVAWFSGSTGWFQHIVLPLVVLAVLMSEAMIASIRQKLLHGLYIYAVCMFLTALLALATELLCSSALYDTLVVVWSPFVMIPLCVIGLLLLLIEFNQPLRSELQRRLHI